MNSNRLIASVVVLAVASAGVVMACSSDETKTPAGTTTGGGTTTVHVSAAAGGTVADPTGKTKLEIPPGALAADTDITLTILPKSGAAVVDVSEFGPDGLQFLKPVTLTIKADAALATGGKTLALAVNEGADFKAITGSTFANGAASAPIMHFSRYTVIFVDGQIVVQPPATCVEARSTFKPCGGDLKGTWRFAEFCAAGGAIAAGGAGCPETTVDIDYTIDRDVVIDATTITLGAGTNTIVATYNYFLACFGRLPDGGASGATIPTCAEIQQKEYTDKGKAGTCVDKAGGYCSCTETGMKTATADAPSTYTTSGTTLTTNKPEDGGTTKVETSDYCVGGDLLTVRETGNDGGAATAQIYVLKRK